jgi:protein tyrosine phosphatase
MSDIVQDHIWKTSNGTEIKISEMSSEHIASVISLLKSNRIKFDNSDDKYEWLKIFAKEKARRLSKRTM